MTAYNVIDPGKLVPGEPEDISVILANFQALANVLGALDNGNLSADAAIAISKLANYPGDPAKILKGDGSWGSGGGSDLSYDGAYVPAATYNDGDVVVKDGIAYLCVAGPTAVAPDSTPWGLTVPSPAGYGTTLPASPVNGQEHILVDSVTAPTYYWRLRYNAGSASPYKWEYIGGIPATIRVDTGEAFTTDGWGTMATSGPNYTLPFAGDWDFGVDLELYGISGTGRCSMGYAVGATASQELWASNFYCGDAATTPTRWYRWFAQAAGVLFSARYHKFNGGGASGRNRRMQAVPVRISA
jgi:hypothetical protein